MIKRLASSPPLHFALIGAALYLTQPWWAPASVRTHTDAVERRIVVSRATLDELQDTFVRTAGRPPTAAETDALVRDWADTEILYREALARGLDAADRSIRWRLVQKMQFLNEESGPSPNTVGDETAMGVDAAQQEALYREALALGLDRDDLVIRRLLVEKMRLLLKLAAVREPPSEDDLLRFYERTAEDYRQPARVSLRHVFLSADRRGDALEPDAVALLERLRGDPEAKDDPAALGDVFPLGHQLRASSEHNLAKLFGPDFAHAAIELEPGAWHGPLRSAYGLHLVWVDERRESALPGLEPVRSQVAQRYLAELRDAELRRAMSRLRAEYAVHVAGSGDATDS